MNKRLLCLSLAVLIGTAPAARAQWVVVDPTNLMQNTITAVRTLEQINNQIVQLQNEAQMLINQGRNLENLSFNSVGRLRSMLATSERLISRAEGLAFEVQGMDQQFERLYPEQYAASVSSNQMYQDARQRWQHARSSLQTAMQMQAQVAQSLGQDEGVLADLVGQSQSASGALQAAQATNQLLALQAKQSIQAQQLQLTQGRAMAAEQARQAAAIEQGHELTRRFLGSGTAYTPQYIDFFKE